ncbi:LINE-1 reverse transcriptase-like protein [Bienertia sinuspersici]
MIYAFNENKERKTLWEQLRQIKKDIRGPWIITGDFNCRLTVQDRVRSPIHFSEMEDFIQCMADCELTDLHYTGCKFTWSNNQQGEDRVMSKIDRCLINAEWLDLVPTSTAHYHEVSCSDHSPGVISLDHFVNLGKRSFMFCDMWCKHRNFKEVVHNAWRYQGTGSPMFKVVQKQKAVKQSLQQLNKQHYSQIEERFHKAKGHLLELKRSIQQAPNDPPAYPERIRSYLPL